MTHRFRTVAAALLLTSFAVACNPRDDEDHDHQSPFAPSTVAAPVDRVALPVVDAVLDTRSAQDTANINTIGFQTNTPVLEGRYGLQDIRTRSDIRSGCVTAKLEYSGDVPIIAPMGYRRCAGDTGPDVVQVYTIKWPARFTVRLTNVKGGITNGWIDHAMVTVAP